MGETLRSEKTVWVLEDDPGSQFVYEEILSIRYRLQVFPDLASLRDALLATANGERVVMPNLLIADLRLPDDSFLSLLKDPTVRGVLNRLPFLVASSLDDMDVLRHCFRQGALDYIVKPFSRGELVVKVERVLGSAVGRRPERNVLHIDLSSLAVYLGDRASPPLTAKELQILNILREAPLRTATREEIVQRVWGSIKVGSKSLDVHVFNLRKKLDELGLEIVSVAPASYQLIA